MTRKGLSRDSQIYKEMLESADIEKRRSAARALQLRRGKRDLKVLLPIMIERLNDPDSEVRLYVHQALVAQTGKEDFPHKYEDALDYYRKNKADLFQETDTSPAERMRQVRAEMLNARGIQAMLMGSHITAQKFFADALALDFDNPAYHNNLGLAYFNQKGYKSALGKFKDALALNSSFDAARMNLGRCHFRLAQEDQERDNPHLTRAQEELSRVVKNDKKKRNWAARHEMARVYLQLGEIDKSSEVMISAVRILPNAPELRVTLAIIYYAGEQYYLSWKQLLAIKALGAKPNPDFVKKLKGKVRERGYDNIDLNAFDYE